jgi:hypothetical protein
MWIVLSVLRVRRLQQHHQWPVPMRHFCCKCDIVARPRL